MWLTHRGFEIFLHNFSHFRDVKTENPKKDTQFEMIDMSHKLTMALAFVCRLIILIVLVRII